MVKLTIIIVVSAFYLIQSKQIIKIAQNIFDFKSTCCFESGAEKRFILVAVNI